MIEVMYAYRRTDHLRHLGHLSHLGLRLAHRERLRASGTVQFCRWLEDDSRSIANSRGLCEPKDARLVCRRVPHNTPRAEWC